MTTIGDKSPKATASTAAHDPGDTGTAAAVMGREEYPVDAENDHYVTRRGFAKLLTLGSGLLVAANAIIAVVGEWFRRPARTGAGVHLAKASSIATGESILFRYPSAEDP